MSEHRSSEAIPPGLEFFPGYAGIHLINSVKKVRMGGWVRLTESHRVQLGWWAWTLR